MTLPPAQESCIVPGCTRAWTHSLARRICSRTLIVLLLVSVAGLSTFAKDSLYQFHSSSARYVSISNKMQLAHAPVVEHGAAMPVLLTLPAMPESPRPCRESRYHFFVPSVGVTLSLQHRSPPYSIS